MQSIRKRSFSGQAPATYAQLYFEREELTLIMLADDVSDNFRKLISAEEAKKVLDSISRWSGKPKAQWKARADAHQGALESGDPFECGKVFKGLNELESQGNLRQQDRMHLKQSLELLTEELASALGTRPSRARKLIFDAADG